MKIVFANRYFFPDQSATSRMLTSIAFALARRGFEVVVVASRHLHNRRDVVLPAEETVSGVRISRLSTSHFGRQSVLGRAVDYLFFHILAFFWLLRNVSAADTAVICTDPPFLSVTSAVALRLKGAVMVNWIMDLFPETAIELGYLSRWPLVGRIAVYLRNWSLKTPGVIICPTASMADYIQRQGLPRRRIAVMHHWSDGDEVYPVDPASNSLRGHWGLTNAFVVGYSGNFGRAHDFTTMIEAARLLKDHADIRFLLIGGGHQHDAVMTAARELDLDNMIFKPLQPIENLAESLSAADIHLVTLLPQLEHCIIPSKFYGIMAAGRPTLFIGDPNGEVARVVADSGCGKSVEIGAAAELAAAICAIRDDPERCRDMGKIARQLLATDYSRDEAVNAWCALLARLQAKGSVVTPVTQGQAS